MTAAIYQLNDIHKYGMVALWHDQVNMVIGHVRDIKHNIRFG